MYRVIQFIRHKAFFVWNIIEFVNSVMFRIRFSHKLKSVSSRCHEYYANPISIELVEKKDLQQLSAFFRRQPENAFTFFQPHGFDMKTLSRLHNNPSFIMFMAKCDNRIVGYAFLRAFFNGKAFRGKMVDIDYRGKGIAKIFGRLTMDVCTDIGLRLYGTISKSNISSMASSQSVNEVKIVKELPDNYLLIQYLPKK